MKIDINKKYRTRDGRDVTLLHRRPDGWPTKYPWHGITSDGIRSCWTDTGIYDLDWGQGDDDLIEVREPREFWLNIYPVPDSVVAHKTLQSAEVGKSGGSVFAETIRVREILD